ncbi:hypothetical protein [Streptomyces sparsogenes]|uniref:Uncharacterized protein n=1 Tax=Streptomyces sparsogenes DSM 40356 TaxID=1331668 RepID=A0A1R1S8F9_9ACTN|nr:hypothetical protein [Streptomyces sparsogenes]OMI34409.1 hypothetical protein SPAR_36536 [Streptomyces sparsogenes DSM 40356]
MIVFLAGLARLRIALMIAGLSWLFGIVPPVGMRILLGVLVLAALVLDGLIDEDKISRHYVRTKTPDEYKTTA